MNPHDKILVLGARGLVGSALVRALRAAGYDCIFTPDRGSLDLTDPAATLWYFKTYTPQFVFVAAATVGGIEANSTRPVDFLRNNLLIATSVLSAAHKTGVTKLLYLGSSCIYPRDCPQPILEEYLLTGPLEPTNQWYALAKIAGLKLCEAYRRQHGCNFIAAMPCNLYGPGDNYRPTESHVIPALIHRFHHGESGIHVWGSPHTLREFLFVDDLAEALLILMRSYDGTDPVNIGSSVETSIGDLAFAIAHTVGVDTARITFDSSKPSGTPRKLLDSSTIRALGWRPSTSLADGLAIAYADYCRTPFSQKTI